MFWVTVFLNWLEAIFIYKLPVHDHRIRFVTKLIAFKKFGIHVLHYEVSA